MIDIHIGKRQAKRVGRRLHRFLPANCGSLGARSMGCTLYFIIISLFSAARSSIQSPNFCAKCADENAPN
jgi:hypothetical protein